MEGQLLTVKVGPYYFGAPVAAVTEILADPQVTSIPQTPAAIAGVAVVRGQALTVLTLRPALGLSPNDGGMALRWGGHRSTSLIAVDYVESLWTPTESLPPESWEGLMPSTMEQFVTGAFRYGSEWLWTWADDVPDRLQETMVSVT